MTQQSKRRAAEMMARDHNGELFPIATLVEVPEQRPKTAFGRKGDGFHFSGRYAIWYMITQHRAGNMPYPTIVLAQWLGTQINHGEPVVVSTPEIVEVFPDMSTRTVAKHMKVLAEHGLIVLGETKGLYVVNPALAHHGPTDNHAEAMRNFRRWWQDEHRWWEEDPAWQRTTGRSR